MCCLEHLMFDIGEIQLSHKPTFPQTKQER